MSAMDGLILGLVLLTWPPVFTRLWGVEDGGPQAGERLLRWFQWFTLIALFLFRHSGGAVAQSDGLGWIAQAVLVTVLIELILRVITRYVLPNAGRSIPLLARMHLYLTDNPDNLYYSRYEPHPFLQFTGPRRPVEGNPGDAYIGFKSLKVSDSHKPEGILRVACVGGSTTEDGYPEHLQELLDASGSQRRFQVLNFGMTWWSSIHSVVNYALNVQDFRPDFLVVHDNCNDHHYRGYPAIRGDASHAYAVFIVPHGIDESFYRFSLAYRILRILSVWMFPKAMRPPLQIKDIGLRPGKTYHYKPEELQIFRRNLETLCVLGHASNARVLLATMPISGTRSFGAEHERVYRPHNVAANVLIRQVTESSGADLVDFAQHMEGSEEFFKDAVHCTSEGNRMKARLVAERILESLRRADVSA